MTSIRRADGRHRRAVWRFVRGWTSGLPLEIRSIVGATERIAPWRSTTEAGAPKAQVFCTMPHSPELWSQLRPRLAGKVTRVSVVSPYFDRSCSFLRRIEQDLAPKSLIVGLQPEHSVIPKKARTLVRSAQFVDVTELGEDWASHRLHAKVYRFEIQGGGSVVVSGSANASAPAWTSTGDAANAEMVVFHENGDQVWKALGLDKFAKLAPVDDAGWATIATREPEEPDDAAAKAQAPYLSVATGDGFLVPEAFAKGMKPTDIEVVCGVDSVSSVASLRAVQGAVLCRCADPQALTDAILLRARLARDRSVSPLSIA